LQLEGVETLDSNSIAVFEFVTQVWFKEFYNGVNGRRNRKLAFGDGIDGVNDMETTVTYRDQEFTAADASANREFPTNVITYDQQITYFATSDAPSSRQIVLIPFEDTDGNAKYGADLRAVNDVAFALVQSPIESPVIPGAGGDGGLSGGAIAGIAVGGVAAVLLVAFLAVRMMGDGDEGTGYVETDTRPPGQFNVASSEDVSAMDDPPQKTLGAGDASLVGDQRYATIIIDRLLILGRKCAAALINDWRRRLTHKLTQFLSFPCTVWLLWTTTTRKHTVEVTRLLFLRQVARLVTTRGSRLAMSPHLALHEQLWAQALILRVSSHRM
jgi:hypothetical protein